MSGRRNYKELRERIRSDPERRKRIEEAGNAYGALLRLADLRESRGVTQTYLAGQMGVSQPNVSKIEGKNDLYLSTLGGYVAALGGYLEVRAVFPDETIDVVLPRLEEHGHVSNRYWEPRPPVENAGSRHVQGGLIMEGFKKPDRKARGKFSTFMFLDADQTIESLSALEGGLIDELRRVSEEDSRRSEKTGESFDHGPIRTEDGLSENQRVRREEEVLLKRTGYSQITALLDKLRELGALGTIERYSPEVYEQIEEGELYQFRAEIRLHPFHQFVSIVQGWAEAGRNFGMDSGGEFEGLSREVENAFYGKNKDRAILTVFADMEGADPDYRVAMALKKENLLVGVEELSGKATFVAQVQRKVAEGQKVPAARLVRRTPVISPAEQKMMLDIVPALQHVPGTEDIGLDAAEDDILLRHPAVVMKPLCIYRG